MKVYIAAPSTESMHAVKLRSALRLAGVQVTSRWLELTAEQMTDPEMQVQGATDDLDDIDEADALIALNPESYANRGTGGRHVELGYAVARGKLIVLAGAKTNVFHYLPYIMHVEIDSDLVEAVTLAWKRRHA